MDEADGWVEAPRVTWARPVQEGVVACVTRRTVGRQFLLRPDAWVREAFGYVLAVAAARHGVGVIAAVAMSNHEHLVVWDRRGCLPVSVQAPEKLDRFDHLQAGGSTA